MFLLGRSYNPKLKARGVTDRFTPGLNCFFTYINVSVLHTKITLPNGYYAKNSFLHLLIHAQLTYLPSFISFRGLVAVYWLSESLLMASSMIVPEFIFSHNGNLVIAQNINIQYKQEPFNALHLFFILYFMFLVAETCISKSSSPYKSEIHRFMIAFIIYIINNCINTCSNH